MVSDHSTNYLHYKTNGSFLLSYYTHGLVLLLALHTRDSVFAKGVLVHICHAFLALRGFCYVTTKCRSLFMLHIECSQAWSSIIILVSSCKCLNILYIMNNPIDLISISQRRNTQ